MTRSAAPIVLMALVVLVGPVVRAEPPDAAAERQRFAVTACIDDAQRERRATLGALRREQNLLEEGQRQARAAERQEMLDERAQAEAARASAAAARPPRSAASGGAPEEPHPHATAPGHTPVPNAVLKSPGRLPEGPRPASEEARSRATFDAAQRAAEAHRAEVEAKNARRASSKKPAAPLPVPAASGL